MKHLILAAALAFAGAAAAHDGVKHKTAEEAAQHRAETETAAKPDSAGFPTNFGGPWRLTDHHGAERTEADPDGRLQLVFFGYANCPAICSVALPTMAEIAAQSAAEGRPVAALLITVDPERDSPAAMARILADKYPDVTGLTGDEAALAAARKLFHVEKKLIYTDPEAGPVYAHGSHIFLMSAAGEFLTLLPPITSAEHGAKVVAKYAGG